MRTSVTQLTPDEIDELIQICVETGIFERDDIQTAEDMKTGAGDHGELVSYHPEYGMALVAADPGANQKEHLRFKVWTSVSYETSEADLYPYEIHVGEVIDYMGMPVDNLRVVKWFLERGFKLWPQSIEDAALAARQLQQDKPEWLVEAEQKIGAEILRREDIRFVKAVHDIVSGAPAPGPYRHKPQVIADMLQIHVTEALEKIRTAGHNDDPTAQWMQKWAACALDPDLPRPSDEPPLKNSEDDAEIYDEIDPRWWRGNDAGVHGVLERFEEALDGKYDNEDPCFGLPRLTEAVIRVRDLRRWVNDLQSKLYINCVYCGHRYGPGESGQVPAEALHQHIAQCPQHPLAKALKALNRVEVIAGEAMSNAGAELIALEEIFEEAKEGQQC